MAHTADLTFTGDGTWAVRLRTIGLWTLLGLVLIGVFTLLTFPYDTLHTRLVTELTRQTGAAVHIDAKRALRPLGIEWIGVRLSREDRALVSLGRVTGSVSLGHALQGKPVVLLSIWLDTKGNEPPLTATITFADWSFQRALTAEGAADRVDLRQLVGAPVRGGRAKLSFHFDSPRADAPTLFDGQVQVDLNELAVEQISQQGIRVPEWGFATARASVQCAQQVCKIVEFNGNGPDGSLSATGQVMVGRTPEESRWDVAVTLTCTQAFSQRTAAVGGFPLPAGTPLRLKLIGPLLRPQVSM